MVEHELSSPTTNSFVDACCSGEMQHVRKYLGTCNPVVDVFHSTLGYTALHGACMFNQLDVVKALLASGADVHVEQKSDGATPLHFAAEHGNSEVVAYLLEYADADKFRETSEGWTPFFLAKDGGHEDTADLLSTEPCAVQDIRCNCHADVPTECEVSWQAPHDHGTPIDSYELSLVATSGTEVEQLPSRAGVETFLPHDATTTKRLERLFPATLYHISIRAHNAAGWSESSEQTPFRTPATFPAQPSPPLLASTGSLAFSVDLEWCPPGANNGEIVIEYEIQKRQAEKNVDIDMDLMVVGNDMESKHEGVESKGDPHLSKADSKESEDITEWVSCDLVTGSKVVFEMRESGKYKKQVQLNDISFTVQHLLPETTYEFRIRARNAIGWSSFSRKSKSIRTKANAKVSKRTSRSLTVEWEECINRSVHFKLLSWEIQASVPPESSDQAQDYDCRTCGWRTVDDNVDPIATDFTLHHLLPATMYYIRITPRFLLDDGTHVKPWHKTAVSCGECTLAAPPEPPRPPIVLHAEHDSITLILTLPCDNGEPVQELQLRQCMVCSGVWSMLGNTIAVSGLRTEEKYTQIVTNLEPGREYLYAVRASNANGWSRFSAVSAEARTRSLARPSTPRLLTRSAESLRIEWTKQPSIACTVEMKKVFADMSEVEEDELEWRIVVERTATGVNECTVTDLLPVSSYLFRVRVQAEDGDWTHFSEQAGPFTTLRKF